MFSGKKYAQVKLYFFKLFLYHGKSLVYCMVSRLKIQPSLMLYAPMHPRCPDLVIVYQVCSILVSPVDVSLPGLTVIIDCHLAMYRILFSVYMISANNKMLNNECLFCIFVVYHHSIIEGI